MPTIPWNRHGILRLEVIAVNQRAEVVQDGHNLLTVYR
jgi:hypothetical protein